MTKTKPADHPQGATLSLGGTAYAHPTLEPLLEPIDTPVLYPGNPRRGDQDGITASIRDLGLYAGIICQRTTRHVLVGNHRLRGLLALGAEHVPVTWVDVDDTRAAAIVARDNLTSDRGGYDRGEQVALLTALADDNALALSGYADEDLTALRALLDDGTYTPTDNPPTLADRFVIPPFTVLDQRAGAWQERKRRWLSLGIQSEVGRGDTAAHMGDGPSAASTGRGCLTSTHPSSRSVKGQEGLTKIKPNLAGALAGERNPGKRVTDGFTARRDPDTGELVYTDLPGAGSAAGVSVFDPVLTELAYRWFSPPDGHVLDPFAGGSVRGIVAAALGRSYTGIELRPEQVQANEAQQPIIDHLPDHGTCTWITGDSAQVLPDLDVQADLLFSCPPYADLEVYSDDPADLSNMPYDEFLTLYRQIIAAACDRLRDDRFAAWVIGDVRDRRGHYRGLVPDTVRAFTDAGLAYYNEAILVTPVGSLPIRAGRQFAAGRKLGKTHQNVLVFCKGDPKAATEACGTVEVVFPEGMDETP